MNDHRDNAKPVPGEADLWVLSALVDGELSAAEHATTLERLAGDTGAALRVAEYRAQKGALKALFAAPGETTQCFVMRRRTPWWRRAGVAAAWLVVGGALGLALGLTPGWVSLHGSADPLTFAKRADIAYAVYQPEQRHPVEVTSYEGDDLVKWLAKRLDHALSAPSLQEYGYMLIGGRLLPGEAGPAAQLMYQNAAHDRVTLYMARLPKDMGAFRVFHKGMRNTFYWTSDGMGYALSGQVSEAYLHTMALDVCSALGGHPDAWR